MSAALLSALQDRGSTLADVFQHKARESSRFAREVWRLIGLRPGGALRASRPQNWRLRVGCLPIPQPGDLDERVQRRRVAPTGDHQQAYRPAHRITADRTGNEGG